MSVIGLLVCLCVCVCVFVCVCVCVCVCVFLVSQLGRINVRVVGSDIRFTFSVRAREERQKASWFEQVAVLGTNSVNMP